MSIEADNGSSDSQFKKCGSCGRGWDQWPDFILDPDIRPIGFQAIPGLPEANLLVFEHRCGSSISVLASRLRHILPDSEPAGEVSALFGKDSCSGHCRFLQDLESCDRMCINARDRRLILMLLIMKKTGCASTKARSIE
jgi:hypothetical protein